MHPPIKAKDFQLYQPFPNNVPVLRRVLTKIELYKTEAKESLEMDKKHPR